MKKVTLAIALAALLLFAGCKKDKTTTMTSTLKANIEQNQGDGSKTALNPTNGAITWMSGDQILVSNGSSTKTFVLTSEPGLTTGTFTCSGEFELGTNNMALYPATGIFNGNTLNYTLPAEQEGALGTFANGANPMLAVSDNANLTFTSLCGVLGLSLTGDNIAITAIEIVDNGTGNHSMLNGAFTVDCTSNQPVLTYAGSGGTNSLRLNCATTLTSEPQEFYIVLPVGTLASTNGFTMNLYNDGVDPIFSKTRGAALEMQYNTVRKMNTFNVTLAPEVIAPEVTTSATVSNLTSTGATCGGTVVSDGNGTLSAYGISYSTDNTFSANATYNVVGTNMDGAGDFTVALTGLTDNTTYYFRAYATNEVGTSYGETKSFSTPAATPPAPEGAINGLFSVSATKQVYFSQGNLQYIGSASTPYWKFAENQWDCIGSAQNGAGQGKDRDLFGWGTSGWNNGNYYYRPWDTYWDNEGRYRGFGYGPYDGTGAVYNLTNHPSLAKDYSKSDWGVYNRISNGGNQAQLWRTLTGLEWGYVFNTRTTSSGVRYAKANVNNVNGVILLPDDWDANFYSLSNTNSSDASFSSNILTAAQWSVLEQIGAVFLPAAGARFPYDSSQGLTASVYDVGVYGYYWSVSSALITITKANYRGAEVLSFNESNLNPENKIYGIYQGRSVRLVRDVE